MPDIDEMYENFLAQAVNHFHSEAELCQECSDPRAYAMSVAREYGLKAEVGTCLAMGMSPEEALREWDL